MTRRGSDVGAASGPPAAALGSDAAAALSAVASRAAAGGDPERGELDDRKVAILRAIVTEFVAAGEPVGSKRVVDVAQLPVSAATVRNDMVFLEELGYISQPHTSAGRVPTDKGYRYFVDDLREDPRVDEPQRELVRDLLGNACDLEDLLARTTTVLSQLTRLVSLVIAPALATARVKLIELVSLSPTSSLLLVVADTGRVTKRLVEVAEPVSDGDVERVRTVLGEHARGRQLAEVPGLVAALSDAAPSELRELLHAAAEATKEGVVDDPVQQVFVGGQAALAGEPSFERDQLTRLLELLEERRTLARLLSESASGDSPTVRIGGEVEVEGLQTAALVAQRYRLITAGSLGVLGPTRMDYATVLGTVRAVADQLQRTLSDLSS